MIGLMGLVHAKTVANVIEARVLVPDSSGVIQVPAPPAEAAIAGRKSAYVEARNVFNSAASAEELPDPEASAVVQTDLDPSSVPVSDLALTLAGAIYSPDSRWSLAIVEEGSTTRIAQVGNQLKPDATLVAIWAEEAWVRRQDGRIERLKAKAGGGGSSSAGAPPPSCWAWRWRASCSC